jgi:hypothetical protein
VIICAARRGIAYVFASHIRPSRQSHAVAARIFGMRRSPASGIVHFAAMSTGGLVAKLAESKTPLTPPAPPAAQPAIDLDTAQLDQIIGVEGQANGGVYQFAVPRRDPVSELSGAVSVSLLLHPSRFVASGGGGISQGRAWADPAPGQLKHIHRQCIDLMLLNR